MAEILVKVRDSYVPGKGSAKLTSRPGSPIAVKPDGFRWGKKECLPTFFVVHVYDKSCDELRFLTDAKITEEDVMIIDELGDVFRGKKPVIHKKFIWRIRIQDIMERIEDAEGFIRMGWSELQSRLTGNK